MFRYFLNIIPSDAIIFNYWFIITCFMSNTILYKKHYFKIREISFFAIKIKAYAHIICICCVIKLLPFSYILCHHCTWHKHYNGKHKYYVA